MIGALVTARVVGAPTAQAASRKRIAWTALSWVTQAKARPTSQGRAAIHHYKWLAIAGRDRASNLTVAMVEGETIYNGYVFLDGLLSPVLSARTETEYSADFAQEKLTAVVQDEAGSETTMTFPHRFSFGRWDVSPTFSFTDGCFAGEMAGGPVSAYVQYAWPQVHLDHLLARGLPPLDHHQPARPCNPTPQEGRAVITAADSEYHPSDPSVRTWAETIVMVFSVPEAGILGNAYVLARPNVGAAISAVTVHSGFCMQPYQMDFTDPQVHVPAPERFSDFTLPTGLSVKVTDAPRDFDVRYEHELGACRLDLAFRALHDPFDVHDPEQNPLVAGTDGHLDTGLGDVWANGHFDTVGHVTGTLELRGREYQVDCFDGMDRSWGPRAELGDRGASWIHVTFDTGFAVHLGMALDYRDGEIVYQGLRFGYVVEDGQVYGVTEATVQARRIDMISVSNHITLTDARGRSYEFFGTAVGGAPWHSFSPAYISYQSLFRYEYDGRVGHAEATDVIGLEFLAERMSRHGRQQSVRQPSAWPSEKSSHVPTRGTRP